MPANTFDEVLNAIEHLPVAQQADLIDLARRRLAEHGRIQIIEDAREARAEHAAGKTRAVTVGHWNVICNTSLDNSLWIEDLSLCTYFPTDVPLTAVGWLDGSRPFPVGALERPVFEKLIDLLREPWQPFVFRGFHECNLCQFSGEAKGTANLFVPFDEGIYVCPEMITHYINAHGYAPPEPFRRAVLGCPPMRSMAYLRMLSLRGGLRLVKSGGGTLQ